MSHSRGMGVWKREVLLGVAINQWRHVSRVGEDIGPVQAQALWSGVLKADSQWCFPKKSHLKERSERFIRALVQRNKK